jgi:glycosyltransferase involved in cell wall biosynthesis
MHVLIPVFFTAPLGGLQAHVRRQAEALLRAGHRCTVVCKPGPFAESIRALPISVIETSFENPDEGAALADQANRYDLVHAHPFRSSAVGLEVARRQRLPFIVTFHGTYLEQIADYAEEVDLLIAVSPAIRDHLVQNNALPASRTAVIPNGVDTDTFHPAEVGWDDLARAVPALRDLAPDADRLRILFVSRLDTDKQFMLDVLQETWAEMESRRALDLTWWVAGDGTLRPQLEAAAAAINQRARRQLITFLGWQSEATLAKLYSSCRLAIAPGRSALEGMACGKPVIAMGSKGYVGLIDSDAALQGIYGNFGGFGRKHESYLPGSMFRDIDRVIYDEQTIVGLGRLSLSIVNAYFRQDELDRVLLRTYEFARTLTPRRASRGDEQLLIACPVPGFLDPARPGQLSSAYSYPKASNRSLKLSATGAAVVRYDLADQEAFYLHSGSGGFASPPADKEAYPMKHRQAYVVNASLQVLSGRPRVTLWLVEYGEARRLKHATLELRPGENRLRVRTSEETACFRLAFRFSGSGAVVLSPPRLFEQQAGTSASPRRPPPVLRVPARPDFHSYAGENLVFIIGPPRSGTTWLLNLLRNHPCVLAATVDNLDVRMDDRTTLETNIFNDNRPFTDMQIKHRFYKLSQANPGKVIVEKTPVHLLFVDRIRGIFPSAALVLTERDGRDIVASLIEVGRDKSAWWSGAPDTVVEAAKLWREYAEAAIDCIAHQGPYVVRYEELLVHPRAELSRLQSALGLSDQTVDEQIEAARDGKGIPIPGVFRGGRSGGWRRVFTDHDVDAFKRIAGDLLVRLGYEANDEWGLP